MSESRGKIGGTAAGCGTTVPHRRFSPKLPIGRDGRNRPSLFPFCTATGRNAHGKSLYNQAADQYRTHGLYMQSDLQTLTSAKNASTLGNVFLVAGAAADLTGDGLDDAILAAALPGGGTRLWILTADARAAWR